MRPGDHQVLDWTLNITSLDRRSVATGGRAAYRQSFSSWRRARAGMQTFACTLNPDTLAQRGSLMTAGVSRSIGSPRVMTRCPARGPSVIRPCTEAPLALRKQALIALQRVGFFGIAVRIQAAALEQPDDPAATQAVTRATSASSGGGKR